MPGTNRSAPFLSVGWALEVVLPPEFFYHGSIRYRVLVCGKGNGDGRRDAETLINFRHCEWCSVAEGAMLLVGRAEFEVVELPSRRGAARDGLIRGMKVASPQVAVCYIPRLNNEAGQGDGEKSRPPTNIESRELQVQVQVQGVRAKVKRAK